MTKGVVDRETQVCPVAIVSFDSRLCRTEGKISAAAVQTTATSLEQLCGWVATRFVQTGATNELLDAHRPLVGRAGLAFACCVCGEKREFGRSGFEASDAARETVYMVGGS